MPKRKNDLVTLSNLYLNPSTTCYRKAYYALQPRVESEAMRRGREIHRNFEWPRTPARDLDQPLYEDKTK